VLNFNQYKQELLKKRKVAQEEIRDINEGGLFNSFKDSISELSTYDNHPADIGSETFERSKDFALRDTANIWLSKIDEALVRIKDGTYGECVECHQSIPKERLDAEPETDMCINCKEKAEGHGNPEERPIEEQVVSMPYGSYPGRTYDDSLGYDGEDTWQDAMQYSEHTEHSGAGSYYGGADENEVIGEVEQVEGIAYFKGADGVLYEDKYGLDDEDAPKEVIRGDDGWDKKEQ